MGNFLVILFIGAIIAIIIYYSKKRKQAEETEKAQAKEKRQNELESLQKQWEEKKKELADNGLPTVEPQTLQLTKGEVCHFAGIAYYCKLKQQTVGYEGGSRGVNFRIMKGVNFRVGNYKGHYVKQDITERTSGTIYLTNIKIVFTATQNSSVIKYKDILNLDTSDNMLQIQTEKKTYFFQVIDLLNFMVILEYIMTEAEKTDS